MSQCGDDDEEQCASRLMPNISPATATAVRRWRESGDMVIVGDSPASGPSKARVAVVGKTVVW